MATRRSAEIQVNLPLAAAHELAEAGLREIGARYIKPTEDEIQGVIRASIASMGERVTARIVALTETTSRIVIVSTSAIPTTLLDWGKNQKNIDRFMTAVHQLEPLYRRAATELDSKPDEDGPASAK